MNITNHLNQIFWIIPVNYYPFFIHYPLASQNETPTHIHPKPSPRLVVAGEAPPELQPGQRPRLQGPAPRCTCRGHASADLLRDFRISKWIHINIDVGVEVWM